MNNSGPTPTIVEDASYVIRYSSALYPLSLQFVLYRKPIIRMYESNLGK